MNDALQRQQQAVLEALWQPRQDDALVQLAAWAPPPGPARELWARGLAAYRAQGLALAERALADAYPVTRQLVGEDNFNPLARRLWRAHPPMRGDLAQWGGVFPAFLAGVPDLVAEEPYLPDVARVEWALHLAATAADAQADTASVALLTTHDPADLVLVLGPGCATVASAFPVASILAAHAGEGVSIEEAGRRLRVGTPETARIWRRGFTPCVRQATPGEAEFIAAVQERRSLADSLACAPGFDMAGWLAPAVQDGLLLAVRVDDPPGTPP